MPDTLSWNSYAVADLEYLPITASRAGFGWYTHAWTETKELHVRYWVLLAFAAFVAASPWTKWRYSLRMFLLASTVFAVMIGISVASYRQEKATRVDSRYKPKVVYDYGRFWKTLPIRVAFALDNGTDFELLSLDPRGYKATPTNNFHGWMVYGRTPIADGKARKQLLAALRGGVNNADEVADDCFNPRHAIRLSSTGRTYEFVICFECGWIELYVDGKKSDGFTVRMSPQPEFDDQLKAAGVQLAPTYD